MFCPLLFGFLDLLPLRPAGSAGFGFAFAKNVRMPADELFDNVRRDGFKVEGAALAGKLRMEDHLEQKVSEVLEHFLVIIGFDSIEQFVNFLDGVESNAFVVLLAIPGAA